MATELEFVLSKLPGYINTSSGSTFYNVIKAFVDELMLSQESIDELHAMIGVDTTYGEDLDARWGTLLNLPRNSGETDDEYRYRLQLATTSMIGGTKSALKYCVSIGVGFMGKDADRIKVYDAWDYPGEYNHKEPGYAIITVDLNYAHFTAEMEEMIRKSIANAKAAGVAVNAIYYNYGTDGYYYDMTSMEYGSLHNMEYKTLEG